MTGPSGPRIVWRLDPRTLALSRVMRLSCDARFAVAETLWLLDTCTGAVFRLGGDVFHGQRGASDLAVSGGAVWIAGGRSVLRIDAASGSVRARLPARGAFVRASASGVWILDMGDGITGWLRRIDPKTNRVSGRPVRLSSRA